MQKLDKNNEFILEKIDIKEILPDRQPDTHKYCYGRILVIAGSKDMPGAAALCSNAAIKMGGGIVELVTPKVHSSIYPEIIIKEIPTSTGSFDMKHLKVIQQKLYKRDVIVIGPGMTKGNTAPLIRELVFNNTDKYWVVDGDAISAFDLEDKLGKNVVLTPHLGEFSKLNKIINLPVNSLNEKEILDFAKEIATAMNCNILLKGSTTIITDGDICYYNKFGNAGMATAGSGDVLSGIIAANLAKQNKKVFEVDFLKTIALSSAIHSLAGDYYANNNDMETLIATDIIDNIKNIIKEIKI